jgi:hypothetical protein
MYAADQGPRYSFVRPDGCTLYDFQLAAALHCAEQLQVAGRAVLALDTGLGKTCVVRTVVELLGGRALVIVPGGLVRQVSAALARLPWETKSSARVALAETGKQLQAALTEPNEHHKVLVANRALRFTGHEMSSGGYGLLVVDEAHQRQSAPVVRRLGGNGSAGPKVPTLFVTATPESSWVLPELVFGSRGHWDNNSDWARAIFAVRKSPRVLNILGVAKPRLLLLDLELPTKAAYEAYDAAMLRLVSRLPGAAAVRLGVALGSALARLRDRCACEVRAVLDRVDQQKLACGLLADALAFVNGEPLAERRDGWTLDTRQSSLCGCCGLTSGERSLLARAHAASTPDPPPPWRHEALGVTSAIMRFPSKHALDEVLRRHPIPQQVSVHVLTSDKSAAYRAGLVRRFAGRDGQKASLAVLRRAADHGTAPELFLRVCALGMGTMFLSVVEQCLARPRLLLADATVDVGFDLHRHVDGVYVPRIPSERSDLQQIVGRVCRIAPERTQQGTVDVISSRYVGTADDLLWSHLKKKEDDARPR